MTDIVNVRVSPNVKGAYVFKVPCSFSPTGIHYVTIMTGEKTSTVGGVLGTRPHMLHISCECTDTVPKDILEGMTSLREVAKEEGGNVAPICTEVVHAASVVLNTRGVADWNTRNAREREVLRLPQSMRPVITYLCTEVCDRKGVMDHLSPIRTPAIPNRAAERAAKRFSHIFNNVLFEKITSTKTHTHIKETQPFVIQLRQKRPGFHGASYQFALTSTNLHADHSVNNVIAIRQQGKWYIRRHFQDIPECQEWASHLRTPKIADYCPICDKEFEPYARRRHTSSTEGHIKAALSLVKLGLYCTQYFPKLLLRPERVLGNFAKCLNVVEVTPDEFKDLYNGTDYTYIQNRVLAA